MIIQLLRGTNFNFKHKQPQAELCHFLTSVGFGQVQLQTSSRKREKQNCRTKTVPQESYGFDS